MMMACDDDLSLEKRFEFEFLKSRAQHFLKKKSLNLNWCVRVLVDTCDIGHMGAGINNGKIMFNNIFQVGALPFKNRN